MRPSKVDDFNVTVFVKSVQNDVERGSVFFYNTESRGATIGYATIKDTKMKEQTGGRYILGKGVSKSVSKSQKQLFCEENGPKKVVQFQNGIFQK